MTNPNSVLALAPIVGASSNRLAVRAALTGKGRREVVGALAQEADDLQQREAARLARYEQPHGPISRRAAQPR